jgi:micrococcal nuclease
MHALILLILVLCLPLPAQAEDIQATVVRVRDGDTITVRLVGDCMPKLFRLQGVRLLGCDTPERKDKREDMAALAAQASEFTSARLRPGDVVTLHDVRRDKYGGRLVARIEIDGVDLCRLLMEAGLAREYTGQGGKPW